MELTVDVTRILYRNDNSKYVIFSGMTKVSKIDRNGKSRKVKSKEVFKGTFFSLFENDTLKVEGDWREDDLYGKEFVVDAYSKVLPQDQKGIEKFLTRSVAGIGEKKARAITEAWGVSALSKITEGRATLDEISLLTDKDKDKIYAFVIENISYEKLLTFMRLHSFDYTVAMRIYKRYRTDSLRKIMDNPYALCFEDALTFYQADKIALGIGHKKEWENRLRAGLLSYLSNDVESNGNMYTPKDELLSHFNAYMDRNSAAGGNGFDHRDMNKMLDKLYKEDKLVYSRDENQQVVIYLSKNMYMENQIADLLNEIMKTPPTIRYPKREALEAVEWYESHRGITLAIAQKRAIVATLTSKVSILTGGPGTGKTQTVSALIACMKHLSPLSQIHLCSPTGRASKKLSEMCGEPAATIHRLLRINEDRGVQYDGDFEGDLLIVDESSMVDVYLFYKMLKSLSPDIRILIIGDNDQLPSVGPGTILKDLIDSELITTTRLTEIFRQKKDSTIIPNAHQILKGGSIDDFQFSNSKNGDCFFFEGDNPSDIQDLIMKATNRLMKGKKLKLEEIEILSPIKDGALGTEALNGLIQARFGDLGDDYVEHNNKRYYVGDKVIHTENDYTLNVFNGEMGVVSCIPGASGGALTVEYPDKDIDYEFFELEELDLAFSITVHKSQGSEFTAVIIPVHSLLRRGLSKTILYTACTRAKSIVIFVGSKDAMIKGVNKQKDYGRRSMLKSKLQNVFENS